MSDSLKDATLEELTAELKRRELSGGRPPDPAHLVDVDWTAVYKTAVDGITDTIKNGYQDEDLKYYIYESVVTAIYGDGYWEWRNKQKW